MAIPLGNSRGPSTPVIKRRVIGEAFVGAIVNMANRPSLDTRGEPKLNAKGNPATETVVTCLVMPNTTMVAGIGGVDAVPAAGDTVRAIFTSGGLAQWIEAQRAINGNVNVGDVLIMTTTHAVIYDQSARAKGELRTGEEVAAYDLSRMESLAFRGDVRVRAAKPDEAEWVERAEAAYRTDTAIALTPASVSVPAAAGGMAAADLL